MNLDDVLLKEVSWTQRENIERFHLSEVPRAARIIETENRMVVIRGWERGKWGIINEDCVSIQEDEKFCR